MPYLAQAQAWREHDVDPDTVAQVDRLLEQAEAGDESARTELESAFAGPL